MTGSQLDLFDPDEGERRKKEGMTAAEENKPTLLEEARRIALHIASTRGTVTADDVYAGLLAEGFTPSDLGNAAGALFRGKMWRFTNTWRKSPRATNHARENRVWVLA